MINICIVFIFSSPHRELPACKSAAFSNGVYKFARIFNEFFYMVAPALDETEVKTLVLRAHSVIIIIFIFLGGVCVCVCVCSC